MIPKILIIALILVYHFVHNGIEKQFSQLHFKYDSIRRPLDYCDREYNCNKLYCTGMPSGHVEIATILCILLELPMWITGVIVVATGLQRIITHMHTLNQVIAGAIMGLLYSATYLKFGLKNGMLLIVTLGLVLTIINIHYIDHQVKAKLPDWVHPDMYSSIQKKQNVPFYIKLGSLYVNSVYQNVTFISWKQLEQYLDIIVEKIIDSGKTYDAVVGIKTGGSIISDYVAAKLNLPNYRIKLSRSSYKCNKQPKNTLGDMLKKHIEVIDNEFTICEGIDDDLSHTNVILIDEIIFTGKTIEHAYNYLKNTKAVKNIFTTCVAFNGDFYKSSMPIDYVLNGTILVFPWGYDN